VGKLLFALLTAVIAWFLFKGFTKAPRTPDEDARVKDRGRKDNAVEHMVKCGICGVFMPESESAASDGRVSCRDPKTCAHRHTPQ
jgi:hypothetical protein